MADPVVTFTTPAGPLGALNTPVTFTVSDDVDVALVTALVKFPALGVTECAFHDGSFRFPYQASSLVVGLSHEFTLVREGGWPSDFDLDVSAVDDEGNITS